MSQEIRNNTVKSGIYVGHSYSAAYKYQLVIGKIGGWSMPFTFTIIQVITLIISVTIVALTRPIWWSFGGIYAFAVVITMPVALTYLLGSFRSEGRSIKSFIRSHLSYFFRQMKGPHSIEMYSDESRREAVKHVSTKTNIDKEFNNLLRANNLFEARR